MTGVWVVWDSVCEGYGGFDQIFATEADARGWLDAPERDRDRKYLKVTFVPWGSCAIAEDAK